MPVTRAQGEASEYADLRSRLWSQDAHIQVGAPLGRRLDRICPVGRCPVGNEGPRLPHIATHRCVACFLSLCTHEACFTFDVAFAQDLEAKAARNKTRCAATQSQPLQRSLCGGTLDYCCNRRRFAETLRSLQSAESRMLELEVCPCACVRVRVFLLVCVCVSVPV